MDGGPIRKRKSRMELAKAKVAEVVDGWIEWGHYE